MSKRLFISKSYDELEREAPETVLGYWSFFERELDKRYGKAWAKDHPETIARLCEAASLDFAAASVTEALQGIADCVENASSPTFPAEPDSCN